MSNSSKLTLPWSSWLKPNVEKCCMFEPKNKHGLSCAKLSIASAKLYTSLSSDQLNQTNQGLRILWVRGWGSSEATPKESMMEWAETPCCYYILLMYKFRDHIQKFWLLPRKLCKTSRFQNLVTLRFHVTLVYVNCHNSHNFEATGLIFCMRAWFY